MEHTYRGIRKEYQPSVLARRLCHCNFRNKCSTLMASACPRTLRRSNHTLQRLSQDREKMGNLHMGDVSIRKILLERLPQLE